MTAPAAESRWYALRAAELRDVAPIVQLIRELAEFERLSTCCRSAPNGCAPHLFGERPVAEAMVAEVDGEVVAFALYFTNFDLPRPAWPVPKTCTCGRRTAAAASARRCCAGSRRSPSSATTPLRVGACSTGNSNAIRFYQRMGANR